ncbi:MAG: response regulator [Deltaproteobacteria bacterium]|nr:response regulator [Deltaproteobacteria bacterium]
MSADPSDELTEGRASADPCVLSDDEARTAFDAIIELSARACGTSCAVLHLAGDERLWFCGAQDSGCRRVGTSPPLLHEIEVAAKMRWISDLRDEPGLGATTLIEGLPPVRSFAGTPLQTSDGRVVGVLAVFDECPDVVMSHRLPLLEHCAKQVLAQIEVRAWAAAAQAQAVMVERVRGVQRRFFELSLDMVCVAGMDGYFKQLNPMWSRVLGYSKEELLSRPFSEFILPEDVPKTVEVVQQLVDPTVETVGFENRYVTKSGDLKWMMWSARRDPQSGDILATARDITPLKDKERELMEARDEAERANRVKSDFLASMSHELRTPLNSIIGFTNILLRNRKGALGTSELKYVERVNANGRHLLALINDVLDLSKLEAGAMDFLLEPTDLVSVVREALSKLEGRVEATDNEVYLEVEGTPPLVVVDGMRLQQVVINLVGNALKFTEAGAVEVRLITCPTTGSVRRLEVIDSGIGIPRDKQALIFDAFRQADAGTDRKYGGTGLGLSISRGLCEGMGFELALVSEPGRGTCFAVIFDPEHPITAFEPPLARDRSRVFGQAVVRAREPEPSHPVLIANELAARQGQRPTVLVVDDDADARTLLERYLDEVGYHVVSVDSGEAALRCAQTLRPALITLDLHMPGTNGWQVLQQLRADPSLCDTPVIVCSVDGSSYRASFAGVVSTIDKPIERHDFFREVSHLLREANDKRVLVVEDDCTAGRLSSWVREAGAETLTAANEDEALELLGGTTPDLVLLDLQGPRDDGFSFLRRLRSQPRWEDLPVVMCTGDQIGVDRRSLAGGSANTPGDPGTMVEQDLHRIMRRYLGS